MTRCKNPNYSPSHSFSYLLTHSFIQVLPPSQGTGLNIRSGRTINRTIYSGKFGSSSFNGDRVIQQSVRKGLERKKELRRQVQSQTSAPTMGYVMSTLTPPAEFTFFSRKDLVRLLARMR